MTSGGLTDPHQSPEGLWAKAWLRFERDRVSAEFERAYLLGRRTRDEFWYAQRFGLRWPELYSPPSAPFAAQYMTEATPSPEPCELNGVDPDEVTICVGRQQEFNAEGENLDGVDWSTDPEGTPSTGEGDSFQTEWLTPGQKTVTATCGESSTDAEVTVIRVTFDTQKVKTGFTKPVPESTISRTLFATVEPASAVESVVMQVSGEDRATFMRPYYERD